MKTSVGTSERMLILMRHAQAGDPEAFQRETGRPDRDRPLTAEGLSRNQEASRGLGRLLKCVDHVWSSPYLRARQTAEGVGKVFGCAVENPDGLMPPWERKTLAVWVDSRLGSGETGVLVGHEPDLSSLLGHWLCADARAPVPMEKGTVCALRVPAGVTRGTMELVWKLPQHVLRKL